MDHYFQPRALIAGVLSTDGVGNPSWSLLLTRNENGCSLLEVKKWVMGPSLIRVRFGDSRYLDVALGKLLWTSLEFLGLLFHRSGVRSIRPQKNGQGPSWRMTILR